MNNQRRKNLEEVKNKLCNLYETLTIIIEEEEEAFDNMPENLQESERGERIQEILENLNNAYESMEEIMDYIEEAITL